LAEATYVELSEGVFNFQHGLSEQFTQEYAALAFKQAHAEREYIASLRAAVRIRNLTDFQVLVET